MKSPPNEPPKYGLRQQTPRFSRLNIGIGVDIEMQQFPILLLTCQSQQTHFKDKQGQFLLPEEGLNKTKQRSKQILKERGKDADHTQGLNWNSKYINILTRHKQAFSKFHGDSTFNVNPMLQEIQDEQQNKKVRKFKIFCPSCQNAPCKTIINSDYIESSAPHERIKKVQSILLFCLKMAEVSDLSANFGSSQSFAVYSLFCSCCQRESMLVFCVHGNKQAAFEEFLPFANTAKSMIMQLRQPSDDMESELDLNEVLLLLSENKRQQMDADVLKEALDFCVGIREKGRVDRKKLTQATQDTQKLIAKSSKLQKKYSQESEISYSINLDKVSDKQLVYKLKNGRRLVSERGFQNREFNLGNFSLTCQESVHDKNTKKGSFRNSEKLEYTRREKTPSWEKKKKLSIASFQTEILKQKAKKDNLHFLKQNNYIVTKEQKIINNLQGSHKKYSPFNNILNESSRIDTQARKPNYWKEIEQISNSVMILSEKNKTQREESPQKIVLPVPEKKLEERQSLVKGKKQEKAENSKKSKRNTTHFDGEQQGSQLVFPVQEKKKMKSSLKCIPENHYGKVKERTGTKNSIRFIPEQQNEQEEKIKCFTKSSIKCIPQSNNIQETKKGQKTGLKQNGGSCKSLRHKRVSFSVKSIAQNTQRSEEKSMIILKFQEIWRDVEKEIDMKINPIGSVINDIKQVFKKEGIKSLTELFLLYKKFFYIRTTLLSNLMDADEPMVTCCSLSEWREVLELKEHKNKIKNLEKQNSLILQTLNKMHKKVACRTQKSIDFTKEPHIYDITIDNEEVYDKFIKKMVRMNARRCKEVYKLTASKEIDRKIVHKYWRAIILASLDELGNSEYQRAFNWTQNEIDENSGDLISQVDALVSFINEI